LVHLHRSVDEVSKTWEAIKQTERNSKNHLGILADIPLALPALPRAQKVQKRAAQVNFDWVDTPAVLDKLQEELEELRRATSANDTEEIHDELGDVLFTTVNLARHLGMDAEESLRRATAKFERRFRLMEKTVAADGGALSDMSEVQLDHLWRRAKEELGGNKRGL